MSAHWIDNETGEVTSRIDIIKDYEQRTGTKLTASQFELLLEELHRQEEQGES